MEQQKPENTIHLPCPDILDWASVSPEKTKKSLAMVRKLRARIQQINNLNPAERMRHFEALNSKVRA